MQRSAAAKERAIELQKEEAKRDEGQWFVRYNGTALNAPETYDVVSVSCSTIY